MTNTVKTCSNKTRKSSLRKSSPSQNPEMKPQSQLLKKLLVLIQSCRSHTTKAWMCKRSPITRVCIQPSQLLNQLFKFQKLPKVRRDFKFQTNKTTHFTKPPALCSTEFFMWLAKIQTSRFLNFTAQKEIQPKSGAGKASGSACTPKTLLSTFCNRWSWLRFSS